MKFSIGDRVLMKRTGEEGIITAFLSKELIEVQMGDIRFPVYADEIDHPYLKWFTDPKKPKPVKRVQEIPAEKEAKRPTRLSRGIYLSFLPQFAQGTSDDIIESFRIHLLNETADHLVFSYDARTTGGASLLELKGALHPFGNIFLHSLSLEALNAQPRFQWSLAPREKSEAGVNGTLRIRPSQLIRHISALLNEGSPTFNILLAQDAEAVPAIPPITVPQRLQPVATAGASIQLHSEPVAVLDLHSKGNEKHPEHLRADQIRLLEQKLDAAHAAGQDSMIVIHGIGSGALREAVHQVLCQTPFVASFSNHWMGAWGWGATEVLFRNSA